MRKKIIKTSVSKVISVNPLGNITSFNLPELPKENYRVKHERKSSVSSEYKELSKKISDKVTKTRNLVLQNKMMEKRLNRNAMINIDKMFNKLIENSK